MILVGWGGGGGRKCACSNFTENVGLSRSLDRSLTQYTPNHTVFPISDVVAAEFLFLRALMAAACSSRGAWRCRSSLQVDVPVHTSGRAVGTTATTP